MTQDVSQDEIREILENAKTVAVVGVSDKPDRASYRVAEYLQQHGYRILPVNPTIKEVFGERSFASVRDIGIPVDVVDIFRRAEEVMPIVDDAIAISAKVVWMQLGIVNEEAAQKARDAELKVVMDHCMKIEHGKL